MSALLANLVGYAWGLPLIVLLLGGGLYLMFVSRGLSLLGFFQAWRILLGKKTHGEGQGQISHFSALTNALSATVGLGNIAGVAVAIHQGGAGAIFWMWISAIIGMNTKFFECTLTLLHREKNKEGQMVGGPMYVIKKALPKKYHFLAYIFTAFAAIGTLSIFNVNQLSHFMHSSFNFPLWGSGVVISVLFFYILRGGIKRFSSWSTKLVPGMCFLYLICGLYILLQRYELIPEVFSAIFSEAFSGRAAAGGVVGMSVRQILIVGMKRAAFSNEAGMGTAPLAHSDAKTNEPVAEGLVAMLGPFIDTIIVCTVTALVILTNTEFLSESSSGILMTTEAFIPHFGQMALPLMGLILFCFSFSTLLGMANYNKKCFQFFLPHDPKLAEKVFLSYYVLTILVGAVWSMDDIVNVLDISGALMAFPNMFATLYLAKTVGHELKAYRKRHPFGPIS